jgi:hypothetical protein
MSNVITLVESDSKTEHKDNAEVILRTEECSPPPEQGCTLTIGYWKNHAGGVGNNPDEVTSKLPINLGTAGGVKTLVVTTAAIAKDVLAQNVYGTPSNGITKLYAQLLGAKLNIAKGANSLAVAATITAADTFLATHNHTDWDSLTPAEQAQVLVWHGILDQYNNGVIGPGHCS